MSRPVSGSTANMLTSVCVSMFSDGVKAHEPLRPDAADDRSRDELNDSSVFFLCSSSDVAEELRLPAAARRPHVRPTAGEGHAVGRGRHAALLRHPGDGDTGRDDDRVSRHNTRDSGESSHRDTVCGVQCR